MGLSTPPTTVHDRANAAFDELATEIAKPRPEAAPVAQPQTRAPAAADPSLAQPSPTEQRNQARTIGTIAPKSTTQQFGALQPPKHDVTTGAPRTEAPLAAIPSNAPAWVKNGTTIEERDGKRYLLVVADHEGPATGILSGKNLAQADARTKMAEFLGQSVLTNTRLEGSFTQEGRAWVKMSIEVPADFQLSTP